MPGTIDTAGEVEAIVLLAGLGRRMQPLSHATHKTLISVGDQPVIDRIIDNLLREGIGKITLVLGYRAGALKEHVEQAFPGTAFSYVYNADFAETNNIVSLSLALETLSCSRCLIVEGDIVAGDGVFSKALAFPDKEIALVDDYRAGMDGTVVSLAPPASAALNCPGAPARIESLFTQSHQQGDFSFRHKLKTLNVYCFSTVFCETVLCPAIEQHLDRHGAQAFYEEVLGVLLDADAAVLHAVHIGSAEWEEIDDPLDVQTSEFRFSHDKRYRMLRDSHGGHWGYNVMDFNFPKNQYYPTPAMFKQMEHSLSQLVGSYGSSREIVGQKMAYACDQDPTRIIPLNGLSEVYPLLGRRFRSGVHIPSPGFGEYQRCFPGAAKYLDPGESDLDWQACLPDAQVLVIVNPNNPTGTASSTASIEAAVRKHPDTLFVVDESFLEFSDQPSVTRSPALQASKNLLVLKSLGKIFGSGGLRMGFVYSANRALLDELESELPIWNTNSLSEYLLELVLKNKPELATSIEKTRADREALRELLLNADFPARVFPSQANFILVETSLTPDQANRWMEHLCAEHSIFLKLINAPQLSPQALLRIAVKTPQENRNLVELLDSSYRRFSGAASHAE